MDFMVWIIWKEFPFIFTWTQWKKKLYKSNQEYVFRINNIFPFFPFTQTHCKCLQSINSFNSKLKTHLNVNRINQEKKYNFKSQLKLKFMFLLHLTHNSLISTALSKDIEFAIHVNMTKAHPLHEILLKTINVLKCQQKLHLPWAEAVLKRNLFAFGRNPLDNYLFCDKKKTTQTIFIHLNFLHAMYFDNSSARFAVL